jgi:hypothetical protein
VKSKSSTRQANTDQLQYYVFYHKITKVNTLFLIDCGANDVVSGEDARVLLYKRITVDIKGIGNHHVNDIVIGNVGGVSHTQHGPVVGIMHQYALLGK